MEVGMCWLLKGAAQEQVKTCFSQVLWRFPFALMVSLRVLPVPQTSELKSGAGPAVPSLPHSWCVSHHRNQEKMGANQRSMQYRGFNRVFCAFSLGQH